MATTQEQWVNEQKAKYYGGNTRYVTGNGQVYDANTGVYYGNTQGNVNRPQMVYENLWRGNNNSGNERPNGSGGASGGGDGGSSSKSAWEDAYRKYIESLQKTRDEALAYRKGLYEQALANNGQYYKDEQRLANREYYTRNRKLAQMYGNDLTGPGLSNRYASSALLTNALTNAKNRQNTANRSAESEYHNALSNIQNAYAQGMYNAYGTEYGIDRNIEYQKYLLEHGYLR